MGGHYPSGIYPLPSLAVGARGLRLRRPRGSRPPRRRGLLGSRSLPRPPRLAVPAPASATALVALGHRLRRPPSLRVAASASGPPVAAESLSPPTPPPSSSGRSALCRS
ncbi:hypothetical protein PVAP13_9NG092073 [Panicum virgatum]|uniref:Uncharacterized protein n=1 Tax=Panicum virgatum TaxID=38727 RepID=A0A8T0MLV3_PANVG|nr:hypothetical protein PVAP13_9NG092073 [Panicum virgatum]